MEDNKPLILVVDDEKDLADNIAEIIRASGRYKTLVAYQAKDAMKLLMENSSLMGLLPNKVQLVILDIKMPEMDGLEFLEMLREQKATGKIGVILLTAFEDQEKWAKARAGEVAGYLLKPARGATLLKQIDLFFEGRERWMVQETRWETIKKSTQAKKDHK